MRLLLIDIGLSSCLHSGIDKPLGGTPLGTNFQPGDEKRTSDDGAYVCVCVCVNTDYSMLSADDSSTCTVHVCNLTFS